MSSQVWAVEMMEKYRLTVDFDKRMICTPCGHFASYGKRGHYQTLYGAITYIVGVLNRKTNDE